MKTALAILVVVLLPGCVSFSEDGGFGTVQRAIKDRIGQEAKWQRSADEANSVRP